MKSKDPLKKASRAAYARDYRAKQKALNTEAYQKKIVDPELKKENAKKRGLKQKEWMQTEEGLAFRKRLSSLKKKFDTPRERDLAWQSKRKEKIHNDLDYCLQTRIGQCRYRAKEKQQPCTITLEYLKSIYTDVCPYLGIPLQYSYNVRANPNAMSIDKINPNLGYVEGNVQIISYKANMMKNDADMETLILFAKNVLERHNAL